jgi:hypothetical protein
MRGMAHALALKSLQIASSLAWVQSNFAHSYWEWSPVYPTSWWEDLLRRQYRKSLKTIPWVHLKMHLHWRTTVPPKTVLLDADKPLPVISLRTFDVCTLRAYMHAHLPLVTLQTAYSNPDIYVSADFHTARPQTHCRIPKIRRSPPPKMPPPEVRRAHRGRYQVRKVQDAAEVLISLQLGSLWHRVSRFLTPLHAHRLALTCRYSLLCAADMLLGHQRTSRTDPSLPHLSPVYGPLFILARHVFQVQSRRTLYVFAHVSCKLIPCELLHIVATYTAPYVPLHPAVMYVPPSAAPPRKRP